jgi:hypothetical protein
MHIPCSQVDQGARSIVLMLDTLRSAAAGRRALMDTGASLNAGFLIRTEDIVVVAERPPLPGLVLEVENRASLRLKRGITWENPAAKVPGANRVLR